MLQIEKPFSVDTGLILVGILAFPSSFLRCDPSSHGWKQADGNMANVAVPNEHQLTLRPPDDGYLPLRFHCFTHGSNDICQSDDPDEVVKWLSGCFLSSVMLTAFTCHYFSLLMLLMDSCLQPEPSITSLSWELLYCSLVPSSTVALFDCIILCVSGFERAS